MLYAPSFCYSRILALVVLLCFRAYVPAVLICFLSQLEVVVVVDTILAFMCIYLYRLRILQVFSKRFCASVGSCEEMFEVMADACEVQDS